MQETSLLYQEILDNPLHKKEVKIVVDGLEFHQDKIFSCRTATRLYDKIGVGNCFSKEINLVCDFGEHTPSKMAEIDLYVRLVLGDQASEWIPKGIFYIYTRKKNKVTGRLTIHGYDAMLKAEQVFLTETTEDDWPQPMVNVVNEIAEAMGVPLDPRTTLNSTFMAQYPLDYTMREILGYVAIAHGGNWIITDAGYLRLVGLADIPDETYYLIDEDGDTLLFGDTRIILN